MVKKFIHMFMVLFIIGSVGGCMRAATKWDHPSATQDQWVIDKAGCSSRARRLADKEYGAQDLARADRDDEFLRSYRSNMRTYDSRRRRQDLYESCLKRLGYIPAQAAQ